MTPGQRRWFMILMGVVVVANTVTILLWIRMAM